MTEQKTNNMARINGSGFKMKGYSYPGTSPLKNKEGRKTVEQYASGEKQVTVEGETRSSDELLALAKKAEADGATDVAKKLRNKANKKISEGKAAKDYLDTTA